MSLKSKFFSELVSWEPGIGLQIRHAAFKQTTAETDTEEIDQVREVIAAVEGLAPSGFKQRGNQIVACHHGIWILLRNREKNQQ